MDEIDVILVDEPEDSTAKNVVALAAVAVMVASTGYVVAKVGWAVGDKIGTGFYRVREYYKNK